MPSLKRLPPEAWEATEPPALLAGRSSLAGPQSSRNRIAYLAAKGLQRLRKFDRARDAYFGGEERLILEWILGELGQEPDERLRRILDNHYLRHLEQRPMWMFYKLLGHHGQRLEADGERGFYADLRSEVFRRVDKTPHYRLMKSLESYGDEADRREQLWEELPGALLRAESEGYFGGLFGSGFDRIMLSRVSSIIGDDNRLLRRTGRETRDCHGDYRDKVVSMSTPVSADSEDGSSILGDFLDDPTALDAYDGALSATDAARLIDDLVPRAGLPDALAEVLALFREGLSPDEIAKRRGRDRDTVDKQLFDVRRKLKAAYRVA